MSVEEESAQMDELGHERRVVFGVELELGALCCRYSRDKDLGIVGALGEIERAKGRRYFVKLL